jgi:hypothetical protein
LQIGHYTASTGRVKPRTFHPASRDHKTSIFRVQSLPETRIWKLGDLYVADTRNQPILARAEVCVADIRRITLLVEPNEPPPRHANIANWPGEKHEWMSKAQELAAVAALKLREPRGPG